MKAQLGQHAEPAVQDRPVRVNVLDRLDARDIDERGQEAFAKVAGRVTLSGESDDGLGEETGAVGKRSPVLEEWVEGLDCGDRQLGLAAPFERQASVLWDALGRKSRSEPCQQLFP
ncbi:hypothetical protein ACIQVO_31765 [Streptomyces sp. NPDC101062]|uniref:hypothetical protein n=1 Tax=unclassified Streptomyces TaxID=2593676 RepID=UPI00381A72DB